MFALLASVYYFCRATKHFTQFNIVKKYTNIKDDYQYHVPHFELMDPDPDPSGSADPKLYGNAGFGFYCTVLNEYGSTSPVFKYTMFIMLTRFNLEISIIMTL